MGEVWRWWVLSWIRERTACTLGWHHWIVVPECIIAEFVDEPHFTHWCYDCGAQK